MRTKWPLLLLVAPALMWVLFGALGGRVASAVSARFGDKLVAKGDGKFANAQTFVQGRMKEGVILVTAGCLLLLGHRKIAAVARQRLQVPARWVVQGWSAFVCLNLGVAVAAHTVFFWSLLYAGKDVSHNYTQWKIKQGLMKECAAPGQAVLLGASQTRTQIDTKVLNERLGTRLWTTELHFPGSTPYDMMLCLERLPNVRLDYVITYVSETTFHSRSDNQRVMYFFGLRDLLPYLSLGKNKPPLDQYFLCGLWGDLLPVYRTWDPLLARVKGFKWANQQQAKRDAALAADLGKRAQEARVGYGPGPECDFKKQTFTALARMCRERGARFVVCCGTVNPIFQRALEPAVRSDLVAFLREQARADSNIVLLDESELPQHAESDYEDLTHVNEATRARFSNFMAEKLAKLAGENVR